MNLTNLYLLPRIRMRAALPPLLHTRMPSWPVMEQLQTTLLTPRILYFSLFPASSVSSFISPPWLHLERNTSHDVPLKEVFLSLMFVTSSLLGPSISFRTQFSNDLSLCVPSVSETRVNITFLCRRYEGFRRCAVAYRGGGSTPLPPKFWSFDKAEPNSQFRGKYIRNCLVFLFHHPN
jgi:hypothetical protein